MKVAILVTKRNRSLIKALNNGIDIVPNADAQEYFIWNDVGEMFGTMARDTFLICYQISENPFVNIFSIEEK